MSQTVGRKSRASHAALLHPDARASALADKQHLCLDCKALFGVEILFDTKDFERHNALFH